MNIRKILLITLLVILVSYITLKIFLKEDNYNLLFEYGENIQVRVKRVEQNSIEKVPLEEYVIGVLSGEMPVSFEIEALKAQAVAARTYVLKRINSQNEYDVVDTVSNQVYLNEEERKEKWKESFQERNDRLKKVVKETQGQYLTYQNQIIDAFFFSTSTGFTENSGEVFQTQLPYLVSVESKWDEKVSPNYQNEYDFSLSEFYEKLKLPYQEKAKIEILKTTSTGRVKQLKINNTEFDASTIFKNLSLKSTFFTITQKEENIHITTKGYGHGVGMSQYGANGMAKEGYTYDKILTHYYQGVQIKNLKK